MWSSTLGGAMLEATRERVHGTMASASRTVKEMASLSSVRKVATSVPAGTSTVAGWTADSQKVASTLAAVGGNSRTPIRSRNLT